MAGPGQSDSLGRWLVGGLAVGAVALGLMVAAYAIGYHRGQDSTQNAAPTTPAPTTPTTTTTTPTPSTPTATTTTTAPAAGGDVALGEQLFTSQGCSGCHSLDGSAGAGPSMKGLAGSQVTLSDGTTVTADDAYLTKAIDDPDAEIVKGYQQGIMSAAISSFGLAQKPDDVAALVAYIKAQS